VGQGAVAIECRIDDPATNAAIAAIVAYLALKVVRPLIKTMLEAPPRTASRSLGGNVNILNIYRSNIA